MGIWVWKEGAPPVVLEALTNREDLDLLENSREQWDGYLSGEKEMSGDRQDGRIQTYFLCFLA